MNRSSPQRLFGALLTVLCLLTLAPALTTAGEGQGATAEEVISRSGHFRLSWRSELNPIVINRMHSWVLRLRDAEGKAVEGARFSVSGGMPAHDHGLATSPRVTDELGDGHYRLEGLRFHMAGAWELELAIQAGGRRDSVTLPLQL